jgi:NTP pyrophosphatase (non-canonical NTP hydrolase)
MPDVDELVKRIVAFRDARDWKQFHNPKDMAISLILEAAELLEHFQWKNEAEFKKSLKTNRPHIADELADVLYWILLICHDLRIDPEEALRRKMIKNEAKYPIHKAKGKATKYTRLWPVTNPKIAKPETCTLKDFCCIRQRPKRPIWSGRSKVTKYEYIQSIWRRTGRKYEASCSRFSLPTREPERPMNTAGLSNKP